MKSGYLAADQADRLDDVAALGQGVERRGGGDLLGTAMVLALGNRRLD